MLDRHRSQNEAWLRARAEENDRERRELCRLRVSDTRTGGRRQVPSVSKCLSPLLGGSAARAGETEGGAERHPETQRTAPVHHAPVQRDVRRRDNKTLQILKV